MNREKKQSNVKVLTRGRVKVLKDGPYEVSASLPVQNASIVTDDQGQSMDWAYGKSYPAQDGEPQHLCRCGYSASKPHCDGTHKEVNFDGTETADNIPYDQAAQHYKGEAVDLYDREDLCAVARFCDVGEGAWRYAQFSGDPENRKTAIAQACHCPSGRLTIVEKDGRHIEPELEEKVSPVQDTARGARGPLWVQGGVEIESADGPPYEKRNRVALCRCGDSQNKPFCDGMHLNCSNMIGSDE